MQEQNAHVQVQQPEADSYTNVPTPEPTFKPNGGIAGETTAKKKARKDRNAYSTIKAEATLQENEEQTTFPIKKPGGVNFFMVDRESCMEQVYALDAGLEGFFIINNALVASY